MQLTNRLIEHVGIEDKGDELRKAKLRIAFKNERPPNPDDGNSAEVCEEGRPRAVGGPTEHGLQGTLPEKGGAFREAFIFAVLEPEGLDEAVALDVLDEEAIEVAPGFPHAFPDFARALRIERSNHE